VKFPRSSWLLSLPALLFHHLIGECGQSKPLGQLDERIEHEHRDEATPPKK
jgi:hypothetical protein